MSQLLKKYALLTACAVLALCFATRPAHAQSVAMSGTGEHLLFAYWSTADSMNTNVAIHSPLGVRDASEMKNVVHVRVRSADADSATNVVTSFEICLLPGESWTANLSMSGLMVVNAGGCDGDVVAPGGGRGSTMISAPAAGATVSLGDADSGFLEAWLKPEGTLTDGTGTSVNLNDNLADNATPRYISGSAMLVSPMSGFASSYNATALVGCGNADNIAADDLAIRAAVDDGDGCWSISPTDANTPVTPSNTGGNPIRVALQNTINDDTQTGSADNTRTDLLTGRWTAINDENVMSNTKLVLTFPMNHLNYAAVTSGVDEQIPAGTDPVSLIAFDDSGAIVLDNREVTLGMAVNTCEFMHADDDAGDMAMPMLSCNDEEVGELEATAGSFRIFNNAVDDTTNSTLPSRTTGGETTGLATTNTTGGQDPAEGLGAIGLICSYFMGTDDQQYDQITSVQSIDIGADPVDNTTPTDNL